MINFDCMIVVGGFCELPPLVFQLVTELKCLLAVLVNFFFNKLIGSTNCLSKPACFAPIDSFLQRIKRVSFSREMGIFTNDVLAVGFALDN
jgi:hypothetical protein